MGAPPRREPATVALLELDKDGLSFSFVARRRTASRCALVFCYCWRPEWVLRSRYQLSKAEILVTFSELLGAVDMSFEEGEIAGSVPLSAIESALRRGFVW